MLIEALTIGGLGFVAAAGLGVAARIFAVEADPKIDEVEENLAGANCGGCGFASCRNAAEAVVPARLPPTSAWPAARRWPSGWRR